MPLKPIVNPPLLPKSWSRSWPRRHILLFCARIQITVLLVVSQPPWIWRTLTSSLVFVDTLLSHIIRSVILMALTDFGISVARD